MLVLSHRGYHAAVPENTMQSFDLAVQMGVDGIETDVRLSADGQLILFHDRVSQDGREVALLSRRELSEAAGYPVPTAEEALEQIPDVLWNLELKTPEAVEATKSLVNRFGTSRRILITSFWHNVVEEFSGLTNATNVQCGILMAQRPFLDFRLTQFLLRKNIETIVWAFDMLDPNLILSTQQHGIRNLVYGAETMKEHLRLLEIRVDGIITDHPQFVIEASQNEWKASPIGETDSKTART